MLVASCSFRPLHSFHTESMPAIRIRSINSIEGSELYRELSDLLKNDQNAKYELDISLDYSKSDLAISKESNTIQVSINQKLHYVLYGEHSKVVTSGDLLSSEAFSTMLGPYNSYVEEEQTKKNLAKAAADDIYGRLMMHFAQKKQFR